MAGRLDALRSRWSQQPERARHWALPVGAILVAVLYPFYVGILPTVFPNVSIAVVMIIFTMMALGLNIVVGYAGLLDLGYVAFYAAGAYIAAWLASLHFEDISFHFGSVGVDRDAPGIHISVWLVLIVAGLFTTVVGILIGLPTLRLRGDYLALVTLGFGEIIPQFVRNADEAGIGFDLTHGTFGITPIDSIGFGGTLGKIGLPDTYRTSENRAELYFWTALVLLLLTVLCSVRLRDSRLGRAWIAIREDETAAAAMGVPLMRTKTWSYAMGAFFGGVAGAFYAVYKSGAFPADFYFQFSVFLLCMVILGGMGSVWGVIVGALILSYLDREGLAELGDRFGDVIGQNIDVPKYAFGIYGAIIVIMMLIRPTGLIPERRHKIEMEEGVRDTPFYDVATEGTFTDRDSRDD
ncbi:MAG: branched-chain amino acid ABC transporter permease [Actinobacteria bacterium]|nr:branched-chain amino acid ABC transporter permease [Actinomycetota bacterium]